MHPNTTRRSILKTIAALPLAFTFALVGAPLLRYARPTVGPLDIFAAPDIPRPEGEVAFSYEEFAKPWTCREFTFTQRYVQYNAAGNETRKIPGYIVKLPSGEIVAYSRICPHLGCVFRYVEDPAICERDFNYKPNGPVFACPCHLSVYDIEHGAKVVSGPAPSPPHKFVLKEDTEKITVVELEAGGIA